MFFYSKLRYFLLFIFLALINFELKNIYILSLTFLFFSFILLNAKNKKNLLKSLIISIFVTLFLLIIKAINPIKAFTNPYKIEKIDMLKKEILLFSKEKVLVISPEKYYSKKISYGDLIIENKVYPYANFLERLKTKYINTLFENFDYKQANFLKAIIFGERSQNIKDIKKDFLKTGNLHLLAISGFHIGIIFAILYFLVRKIKYADIFIFILLSLYIFFTNFAPSALRAFLFFSLLRIFKKLDPVENLFLAGIIYLTFFPLSLSFFLSFLATYAILISIPSQIKLILNLNIINFSIVSLFFKKYQALNFFISFILTPIFSILFVLSLGFVFLNLDFLKIFINLIYNIFLDINYIFSKIAYISFLNVDKFFIFFISFLYTIYTLEKFLRVKDNAKF